MNKEQTPITAWEFYENSDTANVYDVMEQYAQYREKKAVLEALERELHKIVIEISMGNEDLISHYNGDFRDFKEYYETEVKPKYDR